MKNYYYTEEVKLFLKEDNSYILGELAKKNTFDLGDKQKKAWIEQINILKKALDKIEGNIAFEYIIPRIGKRIDNVLIYNGIIYLLEFKVGSESYELHDIEQVYDYALDLKNFHEASRYLMIVPMLISTKASPKENIIKIYDDGVLEPILCNDSNLIDYIMKVSLKLEKRKINIEGWLNSVYKPTPTIIEAAQALYKGHNVKEIARSDAGAININITTEYINKIIDYSKENKKKSICFLTGVPGAGKTLAGLNIGNSRQKYEEEEHAVFLSGNGPLVNVLREALARDDNKYNGTKLKDARRKSNVFIQNIHHFRDDAIGREAAPIEKVVIFDEAQRAWDKYQTVKFMKEKGIELDESEPEFLISVMDRHDEWAVIVCLIGGGQEIHTGEAGLKEWFFAIDRYKNWNIFVSDRVKENEYLGEDILNRMNNKNIKISKNLHLETSLRSFRSENQSDLIKIY